MNGFCNSKTAICKYISSETQRCQLTEEFIHIPTPTLWPVQTRNVRCDTVKVSYRSITYSYLITLHSNRPVFCETFPQIDPKSYNRLELRVSHTQEWIQCRSQLQVHKPPAELFRFFCKVYSYIYSFVDALHRACAILFYTIFYNFSFK